MVNQGNVQKWVDALRSGEYRQTRRVLQDDAGLCCLGVACEAAIQDGVPIRVVQITDEFVSQTLYDGEGSVLPGSVREWLGIHDHDPIVYDNESEEDSLVSLNDDEEEDFNTIADAIEATYLGGDAACLEGVTRSHIQG